MTRKKIGAVLGRPKSSGKGLDRQLAVRMTPEFYDRLNRMAEQQKTSASTIMREATEAVVARWEKTKK